jgi:hypothetical protein
MLVVKEKSLIVKGMLVTNTLNFPIDSTRHLSKEVAVSPKMQQIVNKLTKGHNCVPLSIR